MTRTRTSYSSNPTPSEKLKQDRRKAKHAEVAAPAPVEAEPAVTPPAKRGCKPKAEPATTEPTTTTEETICEAEKVLQAKYADTNIIPGSWRASGGREGWGHKVTVEIQCASNLCPNRRILATSDLFHVRHCVACAMELKANRKRTKEAKKKL